MEENSRKIDTKKLDGIIEACGGDKSHLIAILQKVQEEYKYLPEDALIYIGTKIEAKRFHPICLPGERMSLPPGNCKYRK